MKEVAEDEDSSDISGYHSDSDSAIMMSGNSPYVTKRARHNFLTRSVRSSSNRSGRTCLVLSTTGSSKSSDSPPNTDRGGGEWEWKPGGGVTCCHSCKSRAAMQVLPPRDEREIASLQVELETTRAELDRTKARLELVSSKTPQQELSGPRLVRCYANLYSQARVDALDTLDSLPQLHDAAELKSKILFSVVVLAFRSVTSLLNTKREQVQRILLNPAPISSAHSDLEAAISTFLHRTVDTFDLTHSIDEVSSQLWATLYDYPCLKSCSGLLQYIRDSVRLAWALTNQSPPYVLEYEQRVFRRELHVRFHAANQDSDHIRTYLWPALLQGPAGPCVHKAVVIT